MSSAILINSGRLVDPFKIEEYEFTIQELMHPICMMPRYTGHTRAPYTVGEHTYHLINHVPKNLRRAVALHDLNEGLTNDLPRPFKKAMPEYVEFEERVQRHIFKLFDEPWENMAAIAEYDYRICQDEMSQLFTVPFDLGVKPLGVKINCWPWDITKIYLRDAFRGIGLIQ